jgi:hypothetical protein
MDGGTNSYSSLVYVVHITYHLQSLQGVYCEGLHHVCKVRVWFSFSTLHSCNRVPLMNSNNQAPTLFVTIDQDRSRRGTHCGEIKLYSPHFVPHSWVKEQPEDIRALFRFPPLVLWISAWETYPYVYSWLQLSILQPYRFISFLFLALNSIQVSRIRLDATISHHPIQPVL